MSGVIRVPTSDQYTVTAVGPAATPPRFRTRVYM